jgi:flagellin
MSSILTNTGSMVALQTLRSVNKNLGTTQSEISTGKAISSAKDNAAVWAISKVMESDVKGFKGISDSLSLGKSTVAVARQAAETITDLLTDMKGSIVAAQESNVDRDKIQDDVVALRSQIESVIGAAQFNGLNLIDGTSGNVDILSSLDRDNAGGVTAATITVNQQNLSTGVGAPPVDALAGSDGVSTDGTVASIAVDDTTTADLVFDSTNLNAGDKYVINIGSDQVSYTVTAEDLQTPANANNLVGAGVRAAIESAGIVGLSVDLADDTLTLDNQTGADISVTARAEASGAGDLAGLAGMDVSTAIGASSALADIDSMIDRSIEAAAAFGSAQGRMETQSEFIKNLSDALKSGVGSLVDANMEETSARLQALQVQQQLGIQALSIANQQPQNVLSLFR